MSTSAVTNELEAHATHTDSNLHSWASFDELEKTTKQLMIDYHTRIIRHRNGVDYELTSDMQECLKRKLFLEFNFDNTYEFTRGIINVEQLTLIPCKKAQQVIIHVQFAFESQETGYLNLHQILLFDEFPMSDTGNLEVFTRCASNKNVAVAVGEEECAVVTQTVWFKCPLIPGWEKEVINYLQILGVNDIHLVGSHTKFLKSLYDVRMSYHIDDRTVLKYPCQKCGDKKCPIQLAYLLFRRVAKRIPCDLLHSAPCLEENVTMQLDGCRV